MEKSMSFNWMKLAVSFLFLLSGIMIFFKPANLLNSWMNIILMTLFINTFINIIVSKKEINEENSVWIQVKSVMSLLFFLTLFMNKLFTVIVVSDIGFLFGIWFMLEMLTSIMQLKLIKPRIKQKWLFISFFMLALMGVMLGAVLLVSPFISTLSVTSLIGLNFLILGGRNLIEGLV
ncbi:hypothetical protein [Vagococcus carniphilus]|uniref:hypothetical protein n=1 Tax=Vagococcus carniphilus TaxID=218144 RepID=UPI00288F9A11|nr:hypothetical protein [Vagococcus carniphilus]MDT2815495.1 hypothetical protein [Vagococcus carniphilus]MDT2864603.1 hypothetical protein [Vagococcus carniphilus]